MKRVYKIAKCRKCGVLLTSENWLLSCQKPRNYICITCHREYSKEKSRDYRKKYPEKIRAYKEKLRKEGYKKKWYRIRKERLVSALGSKCQNPNCSTPNGYDRCIEALEIHHVDPTIKERRNASSLTKKRVKKLIKLWKEGKIKLLCANCHREEHFRLKNL